MTCIDIIQSILLVCLVVLVVLGEIRYSLDAKIKKVDAELDALQAELKETGE